MRATIEDIVFLPNGRTQITISTAGKYEADFLDADVEIKKHWEKRSNAANSYAWVLIGQIAEKTRSSKDDVYLELLRRYGQGGVVRIDDINADSILREVKYYELHERIFGQNAAYYRIWVGSSNYNSYEMAHFIDGVVDEAQALGIETLTPDELAKMKGDWK